MIYVLIAAQGFVIVFLTALNVTQIASGHYGSAFIVGGAISYVWFGNSRTAAHSKAPYARQAYSLGAALGTIAGMFIGGLWKG